MYSYIDPCTKDIKYISGDMSSPIMIAYYNQVRSFNYDQLYDGTFDAWMNTIYNKYKNASPCQGAVATTTTTTTTTLATNVINSVMNLNSIASIASLGSSLNVGSATNTGTNISADEKSNSSNDPSNPDSPSGNSNDNSNNQSSGSGSSTSKGNSTGNSNNGSSGSGSNSDPGDKTGGETGTGEVGGNTSENKGGSGSGGGVGDGGNGSGNGGNSGGGNGSGSGKTKQTEEKETGAVSEETENETAGSGQKSEKAASKSKTKTQKPAILVTGDIVGVQTRADGSQDARGTMSFTRVKGDGTSSLGVSADYMINAKIGNINLMKSWIGTNDKGHKHINVLSNSFSLLPKSITNTTLFVRVNSLKKFTAIYGAAGTYGRLFEEEFISTLAIAGFMYKGELLKKLDATIIAAGVWAPYTKYYTESFLEAQPIVIPFLNLNYKLTKTFGIGLTGGGTYISGQDVVNYQVLCGAKLLL